MSSEIDIRASARFIGDLLLTPNMRRKRRPIGVVANRIKSQTNSWASLQRFLQSLQIPYPAKLRDTQNYVKAYAEGKGIINYTQQTHTSDNADWKTLIEWIETQNREHKWIK
jgi:chromosome partitioning protein